MIDWVGRRCLVQLPAFYVLLTAPMPQTCSRYEYGYTHLYAACHPFASDVRYVLPSRGCSESCHTHTVSVRYATYTGTLICQLLTETEAQSHRDSSQELRDTETSQGLRDTSKHTYNLHECINHPYEYKGNRKAQDTHYITIFQIHMLPINSRR